MEFFFPLYDIPQMFVNVPSSNNIFATASSHLPAHHYLCFWLEEARFVLGLNWVIPSCSPRALHKSRLAVTLVSQRSLWDLLFSLTQWRDSHSTADADT